MGNELAQKSHDAQARMAADVTIVLVAFAGTCLIAGAGSSFAESTRLALWGALFAGLIVLVYARLGLYRLRTTVLNLLELRSALEGAVLSGAIFLAIVLLTGLFDEDRWLLALATLAAAPALLVERRLMASLRARKRWMNGDRERTLVYGYNEAARLLMKKIVQAPEAGRELVGFVDDFVADGTEVSFRVDRSGSPPFIARLLGRTADLVDLVREHGIAEILISSPDFELDALTRLGEAGKNVNVRWGIAAQFGSVRPDELVVEDVGAIPVLRPGVPHPHWAYLIGKRVLDLSLALVGLVLTGPFWLIIAAAIWLESGSPVLFRQERVGKHGRRFVLLKFRSLPADTNPYQSATTIGRDQATRVGWILRATTLDELPQLLNVLRGNMSLVGPRPEMPFLVEEYTEVQARRLTVKPGITGVWQLSADRHGTEIHENIEYDLFYITHRSFLLDLVLLFETAVFAATALLRFRGSATHLIEQDSDSMTELGVDCSGKYILVALDQRGRVGLRGSWIWVLDHLKQASGPVRVLASDLRVSLLRGALAEYRKSHELAVRIQLVPYRDKTTLSFETARAELVITDLDEFGQLARKYGISVMDCFGVEPARQVGGRSHYPGKSVRVPGDALPVQLPRLLMGEGHFPSIDDV